MEKLEDGVWDYVSQKYQLRAQGKGVHNCCKSGNYVRGGDTGSE